MEATMDFQTWLRGQDKSELTVQGYLRDVALFEQWHETRHGQRPTPATITSVDVREWLRGMDAQVATRNRKLAVVKSYIRYGQDTGALPGDYDPLARVKRDKEVDAGPRWLERNEFERVNRVMQLHITGEPTAFKRLLAVREMATVMLMRYAGLRVSEVCALEIEDVQLSERKGTVLVRHGKGNKQREVPLHTEARHAIAEWQKVRPLGGGEWLFTGKRGEALQPRGVERRLQEIGRQADVELTPHVLRHTFAKELLNSGATLTEVQRLLGHESVETTARYVQPGANDLLRVIEQMD